MAVAEAPSRAPGAVFRRTEGAAIAAALLLAVGAIGAPAPLAGAAFPLVAACCVWLALASARRLREGGGPGVWLDLAAALAAPAAWAAGAPAEDAALLSVLLLLRVLRRLPGTALLVRVFGTQRGPLAGAGAMAAAVWALSGVAVHLLERGGQPEAFGTLGASLWWSAVTLTTTGYGDLVPQTAAGRVLAAATMACGLGAAALLTSILATGFVAEARRMEFLRTWDLVARVPFLHDLDPSTTADVAHLLHPLDVPAGAVLTRRGERGDCMYFIVSGGVEVDLPSGPVRLGPGHFFGEIALLSDGIRTATVRASEPSVLLMLDVADFRDLAARRHGLAEAVAAEAARRRAASPHSPLPRPRRPTT